MEYGTGTGCENTKAEETKGVDKNTDIHQIQRHLTGLRIVTL